VSWSDGLKSSLKDLALMLRDEKTLSAYEVHLSSLVSVLLHCLRGFHSKPGNEKVTERVSIFKTSFTDIIQETSVDLDTRYSKKTQIFDLMIYNILQYNIQYINNQYNIYLHTYSTASTSVAQPSVGLVRKLISVLEAVEKLSLFTYESPGQVINLQMLNRRFRLCLERSMGSGSILDCSGKNMRVEPLVTVDELESFLNGIVRPRLMIE